MDIFVPDPQECRNQSKIIFSDFLFVISTCLQKAHVCIVSNMTPLLSVHSENSLTTNRFDHVFPSDDDVDLTASNDLQEKNQYVLY